MLDSGNGLKATAHSVLLVTLLGVSRLVVHFLPLVLSGEGLLSGITSNVFGSSWVECTPYVHAYFCFFAVDHGDAVRYVILSTFLATFSEPAQLRLRSLRCHAQHPPMWKSMVRSTTPAASVLPRFVGFCYDVCGSLCVSFGSCPSSSVSSVS